MLRVAVYSPVGLLFEGKAVSVELPSEKGRFMVLENHAPVLALLEKGTVTVNTESDGVHEYAVAGGFAKILDNVIKVCADIEQ